jgi:hypothetical protein
MDDTQKTVEAPPPGSVFSPDDDLASLWIKAYQGEVSGEVVFGGLAGRTDDPDHRQKLEMLCLLEARTKKALVPAMERNGLSTDPDRQTVTDAEALAEAAGSLAWADLMGAVEPITTQFLALYRRIVELAAADDRAEAELLVAHEEAIQEFARRELTGRGADSMASITALPHMN